MVAGRDLPLKLTLRDGWRLRIRRLIHGFPEPYVVIHSYEGDKGLDAEGKNLPGDQSIELEVYY
jgi:hypothetical protein